MAKEFKPEVGISCFYKDIPVRIVNSGTTDFGKDRIFLAQRMVPSTKEVYNQSTLAWEKVPCEVAEESWIWEKDLTEKPTAKK